MSDDKETQDIIDKMNRQSAEACGVADQNTPEAARDIGTTARNTMLCIVEAYLEHGIAPVSTLAAYLQVTIHMLRRVCPDGPLAPMLRAMADLEEARTNGAPPDPALQETLQQLAIALTLSARRARKGEGGLQ